MTIHRKARNRSLFGAVGAALIVVAGACSASDDTSSDTTTASSGAATTAATTTEPTGTSASGNSPTTAVEVTTTVGEPAEPIRVGGVSTGTGGDQDDVGPGVGARARFERANAEGGVGGRQIEFVGMKDDTGDGPRSLQLTRELVQQDDVLAVVPVASPVFQAGGDYLVGEGIPFFGWGITPSFCNNELGFGFNGCLVPLAADNEVSTSAGGLVADVVRAAGDDPATTTVALIAEDSAGGSFGVTVMQAAMLAAGLKVVYAEAPIPANQPIADWSPYVQTIMSAADGEAPDVMFHVTLPNNSVAFGAALTRAGFAGLQFDAVSYNPQRLTDAESRQALQGRYVFLPFAPFETTSPAVEQMLADLDAAGVAKEDVSQDMAIGYWSADMFLTAVEQTGPDVTRESLVATLNGGFEYSVPDGVGAIAYPDGHRVAGACGSLVQVVDDGFAPTIPLTCYGTTPLSIVGSGG